MRSAPVNALFAARGWSPYPFQREVWRAMADGHSGLLHCATGTGKTLAVWGGVLVDALARPTAGQLAALWITPLRALATDTTSALASAAEAVGLSWSIARRTGDSTSSERRRLARTTPDALVTTPESLCVMLSQPGNIPRWAALRFVIVDEWHELLSTKRGVLLELALSRLRACSPTLRTWGLSATLGNVAQAARVLVGPGAAAPVIVAGKIPKRWVVESLLPPEGRHYPWAGHLGIALAPKVVGAIRAHATSIVFTNTRSQAEIWYRELAGRAPDLPIALHHGSLSQALREEAEQGLRTGSLRAVVATSSLDLGVDFAPVECVVQIGSPKGVARLLQRAGRSGHQPGATSKILCVPANTLELVELAAARDLVKAGTIEPRAPLTMPLDVLCQHILTAAAPAPIAESQLLREVRGTHAFGSITDTEWEWAVDFAARGGPSLHAYESFHRLRRADGFLAVTTDRIARAHRMTIGTIASDSAVSVVMARGRILGAIEESFLSRLNPGDSFHFAGRMLELVRLRGMRADVRPARSLSGPVPRWMGGKLPLSSELAAGVVAQLAAAREGRWESPEMRRLRPVLAIQESLSALPGPGEVLIERLTSREGHHIFIHPFAGRLVHEGLAALFAHRLAAVAPNSFVFAVNDYGFELLSPKPAPLESALSNGLFSSANLAADILASLNASELARRKFREIARVAGLTFEGFPGARKSTRQIQVSSALLYDVFARYDPANLLLAQATREVLESQLQHSRLVDALEAMTAKRLVLREIPAPTPFAYPLFVERLREHLSSEELAERVRCMEIAMESHARKSPAPRRRRTPHAPR